MKQTVIISVRLLSPSEVIETLEMNGDIRVTGYRIVNGVGYFDTRATEDTGDYDPEYDYDDNEVTVVYDTECNMCGRERLCNSEGYCSPCWQVWNS